MFFNAKELWINSLSNAVEGMFYFVAELERGKKCNWLVKKEKNEHNVYYCYSTNNSINVFLNNSSITLNMHSQYLLYTRIFRHRLYSSL